MSFKISNNSLLEKHFIEVDSAGVNLAQTALLGTRRFRFSQIDAVLMSSNNRLSLQIGNEVFSIPTNPEDQQHKLTIDFLLHEVRRTTE